jgi:hypothetical protein
MAFRRAKKMDLLDTPPAPTNAPQELLASSMLHYHWDIASSLQPHALFQPLRILCFPILHLRFLRQLLRSVEWCGSDDENGFQDLGEKLGPRRGWTPDGGQAMDNNSGTQQRLVQDEAMANAEAQEG